MPWDQASKSFIRQNTDFTGPTVWQQDQQATIKIIASRHDNHDQDLASGISQCLNLDGFNSLRADLDLAQHKLVNVAQGVADDDAVIMSQFNAVEQQAQGIITDMNWAGNVLTSTRALGDFSVTIEKFDSFKSGGEIRHASQALTGTTSLSVGQKTRFTYLNNGNATLTFNRPSGADPDLGENYCVEGSVLITNFGTAGTLTLHNDAGAIPASNILGIQNTNVGAVMVLTYCIHREAGDIYQEVYSWCT